MHTTGTLKVCQKIFLANICRAIVESEQQHYSHTHVHVRIRTLLLQSSSLRRFTAQAVCTRLKQRGLQLLWKHFWPGNETRKLFRLSRRFHVRGALLLGVGQGELRRWSSPTGWENGALCRLGNLQGFLCGWLPCVSFSSFFLSRGCFPPRLHKWSRLDIPIFEKCNLRQLGSFPLPLSLFFSMSRKRIWQPTGSLCPWQISALHFDKSAAGLLAKSPFRTPKHLRDSLQFI